MTQSIHSMLTTERATSSLDEIQGEDYSSLPHLMRITVYVVKFVKILMWKAKKLLHST